MILFRSGAAGAFVPLKRRGGFCPAQAPRGLLFRSSAAEAVVPLKRRGGCNWLRGVRKKSKKLQESARKWQKTSKNGKKRQMLSKKCFLRFFRVITSLLLPDCTSSMYNSTPPGGSRQTPCTDPETPRKRGMRARTIFKKSG